MLLPLSEGAACVPPSDVLDDELELALAKGPATQGRLGDAVIEMLTRAIIDGRLKPGDTLPSEGRIAHAFGISKQVAREAFRELAALGVIQIQQVKVSRVRSLGADPLGRFYRFAIGKSRQGFEDAVELRRILEPPVARLAAARRTEEQLPALEAALDRLEAGLGRAEEWIAADLAFHDTIAEMCGNRLLVFQLFGLKPVIREIAEAFSARRNRSREDWRRTFERHARIAAAIKAGDPGEAELAMVNHFDLAGDAIRQLFPDDDRALTP
jgi:GntR family transcriptional repressor for pyruvate dehydrogenase complex